MRNHAVAGHGVSFPADGLIRSVEPARALADRLVASGSFTVEARLRPARTWRPGPARIVGISDGPLRRNFTLAQEGRDPVFRLRTSETDPNGAEERGALGGAFSAGRSGMVVTWRPGAVEFFVDGRRRAAVAGPGGRLDAWDPRSPPPSATSSAVTGRGAAWRSTSAPTPEPGSSSATRRSTASPGSPWGFGPLFALALRSAAVPRRSGRGPRTAPEGPAALGGATPARQTRGAVVRLGDAFRPDAAVRPPCGALGA